MRNQSVWRMFMANLIVGVVAYGNSPALPSDGKPIARETIVQHSTQPDMTVRGTIHEAILLGSAGLPAGTPIRAEIVCTWSSDPLQGFGCQKMNPVYERPVQYVAPEPRSAIDYTPEGHLIVHRWTSVGVLNTVQGVFLIEDLESLQIAPNHEVVAANRSRAVTAWRAQAIFWAEALQVATGRIPKTLADSITQIQPQSDGTVLVSIQGSKLPHGWKLYLHPQDNWLIRRAEAISANGEVLYTVETRGVLRDKQSPLVIAAGAQAQIGQHTITIQFTECAPRTDREVLQQLHRRAQDPDATRLDYRVGSITLPDGQQPEPRP